MPFHNRQDAYDWFDTHRPQGPCGLVVSGGGFRHLFVLERGLDLLYMGMLQSPDRRRQARGPKVH